jgi:hypothetical protein
MKHRKTHAGLLAVTNPDWVFGSHDHSDHIEPLAVPGVAQTSPQARFV